MFCPVSSCWVSWEQQLITASTVPALCKKPHQGHIKRWWIKASFNPWPWLSWYWVLINLHLGLDVFSQLLFVWQKGWHAVAQQVAFPGAVQCVPSTEPHSHHEGWLWTGLRCGVGLKPHDGLRCLDRWALVFTREDFGTTKPVRFLFFCFLSIGEAEMFTHIIVFRVVFEATFKQLTPFKKKSLPYHTVGIPGGNNSFERFQNYRDIKSTLQLSFSAASCQVTRKLFPKLFSAIALHVQEGATQLKERPLSIFLYSSASFSPNAQSCLFFFFLSQSHPIFLSSVQWTAAGSLHTLHHFL